MSYKLLLTLIVLLGNAWRTTAFAIVPHQAPSNAPPRCSGSKLSSSRRQYEDGDTFTRQGNSGYSNVPRHEPGGSLARLNEGTRREKPTRRRQQQQRYTGVSHAQVQPDQYYNGQTVQGGSRVTFPGTYNYP